MKDYAAIVFAGHLGLTERADRVAEAFNASAENAKDYLDFKQTQDDRASGIMTQATVLGTSQVQPGLLGIRDVLDHNRASLAPEAVAAELEKLAALKTTHAAEKTELEQLKPQIDALSQLFTILARAEAKMNGFDVETLRHTGVAKDTLTEFKRQLARDEMSSDTDAHTIAEMERRLHTHEVNNTEAAQQKAFSDFLKARPAVPAPTPAPATARFRKKGMVTP